MARGKALSIPVPGPGRKSLYQEAFADQAFKLCLLGAIDSELADFFGVSVATLNNWKREHPAFLASINAGKIEADAEVAHSLYKSATGHQITAEKLMKVKAEDGTETFEAVRYKQFVPGDPNAAFRWLLNRRKADWRDRHEVKHEMSGDLAAALMTARQQAGKPTIDLYPEQPE